MLVHNPADGMLAFFFSLSILLALSEAEFRNIHAIAAIAHSQINFLSIFISSLVPLHKNIYLQTYYL